MRQWPTDRRLIAQAVAAADMDVLVLENCVLRRADQPPQDESARKKYIESFKLD